MMLLYRVHSGKPYFWIRKCWVNRFNKFQTCEISLFFDFIIASPPSFKYFSFNKFIFSFSKPSLVFYRQWYHNFQYVLSSCFTVYFVKFSINQLWVSIQIDATQSRLLIIVMQLICIAQRTWDCNSWAL